MSSDDEDGNSCNSQHSRRTTGPSIRSSTCSEAVDADTIRIVVSTDNHLGFAENDSVRGNDSFAAMEEVLHLAKEHGADMVLLAGDLFHHNKPSRRTLVKTMDLFRRYCLGPNAINIQILSDQGSNFRRGLVNYEDENYSVDLPVFSIHGNHDDPTREGGTELFAALDLLDTANLVNYVGRQDQVDRIEISPILIKKGDTHLALYGLGSMRDERLNRMWRAKKVSFLRPSSDKPWFNLFALHQNRDLGRGAKNCVHESMIPDWMDLVCWGHEHECCIEPHESVVGTFRITQPGSSVATSLTAGEAARKHIGILDIRQQSFRLLPIPLTQVRTFVLGEVTLAQHRRLDVEDPKVEQKITQILEDQVRVLIHDAREKRRILEEAALKAGNTIATGGASPLTAALEKPDEVLVRIKVEHSKFSTLNNQRFGAQFMGQVANPTDILLFHRKKSTASTTMNNTSNKLKHAEPIPPELGDMNIEDLIIGELENSDKNLELFSEKRMTSALESYVQKQLAQAIPDAVTHLLDKKQRQLLQGGLPEEPDGVKAGSRCTDDEKETNVATLASSAKETEQQRPPKSIAARAKRKKPFHDASESNRESPPTNAQRQNPTAKSNQSVDSSGFRDMDGEELLSKQMPKPKSTSNRGSTRTSYNDSESDDKIEVTFPIQPSRKRRAQANVEVVEMQSQGGRTRKDAAKTSTSLSQLSQSQLSFVALPKRKATRKRSKYDDDSEDNNLTPSRSYELDEDWGTAKTDTYDT